MVLDGVVNPSTKSLVVALVMSVIHLHYIVFFLSCVWDVMFVLHEKSNFKYSLYIYTRSFRYSNIFKLKIFCFSDIKYQFFKRN